MRMYRNRLLHADKHFWEFGRVNGNLSSEVKYYHVGLPMSKFSYCTIYIDGVWGRW